MEYKISRMKPFSPIKVELTLNNPDELLWLTEAVNIGTDALSNRLQAKGYKSIDTHIDKLGLWKRLDEMCRFYNLVSPEEP